VLYASGFARRWYRPRADVVADEALIAHLVSVEPDKLVEPAPSAEA
jgi:hypothetical protein